MQTQFDCCSALQWKHCLLLQKNNYISFLWFCIKRCLVFRHTARLSSCNSSMKVNVRLDFSGQWIDEAGTNWFLSVLTTVTIKILSAQAISDWLESFFILLAVKKKKDISKRTLHNRWKNFPRIKKWSVATFYEPTLESSIWTGIAVTASITDIYFFM